MNRNTVSHFTEVPRARIPRSRFDRSHTLTTTINEGDLIPIYVDEVLPGDTAKIDLNALIRMSTPIDPVMDNCYMDTYFFFVPNRLVWENWEEFQGENKQSYWANTVEYTVPQTVAPTDGWQVGSLADYFGIPTGISKLSVNSMPFRAYNLIWNEWFRDENLQQPVSIDTSEAETDATDTEIDETTWMDDANYVTYATQGIYPLKVGKYHDYFTSALPEPQKGNPVQITLGSNNDYIVSTSAENNYTDTTNSLIWNIENTSTSSSSGAWYITAGGISDSIAAGETAQETTRVKSGISSITSASVTPANLVVTADQINASITINELRQAIAIQQILEKDARGGTRYTEILRNHYGVTSPDARLQRPEYLGGERIPINISQVIQTSESSATSPQGNTAAYSLTTAHKKMCTYSATEHGIIIGLAAIRVEHSYQQGLNRMWSRSDRYSYYMPLLDNIGEQAILNKEIYAQGTDEDDEVFGYQEAWAEYRYKPSYVTGEMRSTYSETLDSWHYADYYESLPTLSSNWIYENTDNIDRTIAVTSELSHQFICNFFFKDLWTRPMGVYSIPGMDKI